MSQIRKVILSFVVLALAGSPALASTWNFASGGNPVTSNGSHYGNQLVFDAGPAELRVRAWSNTGRHPTGSFETASILRFSTGLGVCNRKEGSINSCIGGSLDHQVDNVSQQDLVLFLFDSLQVMQSLTIDPWGAWDRDVSFRVGTVSPGVSLTGATFSSLGTLGFGSQVNSLNGPGEGPVTINLGGLTGNALLIGALNPYDGSPDRFKIRQLVTSTPMTVVPLPGAGWLLLSALGFLAGNRRSA